jgi:hypothetical protein
LEAVEEFRGTALFLGEREQHGGAPWRWGFCQCPIGSPGDRVVEGRFWASGDSTAYLFGAHLGLAVWCAMS